MYIGLRQKLSEKIAADLRRVKESKPSTPAGLWAQEDAIGKLEKDLMDAYQAEREQLGENEARKLRQAAGLPVLIFAQDC